MKSSLFRVIAFVVAQVLMSATALAADKITEKPVVADTPDKFRATVQQINSEMKTGGRYEFIRASDRGKVEADLDKMAAMLGKAGSVVAMSRDEQVQLFNVQEHVNGILTHNDSDRLVCEHRAPVGTNIPVTTCRTVGEIERSRRDTQKMMTDSMGTGAKCAGTRCGSREREPRGGG